MKSRTVTLHVFCSAKGGVGKSTLAVATAKVLAASGRRCALVDADMTGTSLMDGLRLRAPKVVLGTDGLPDLSADPTGQYFDVSETRNLRRERRFADVVPGTARPLPVFLNDILTDRRRVEGAGECRLSALYWQHERDDSVRYLPSSPLADDVALASSWQVDAPPFSWLRRVSWLLEEMAQQDALLTDVVVDLAPGLVGFAREMLSLVSYISQGSPLPQGFPRLAGDGHIAWKSNPFIVTSKDANDLLVALDFLAECRTEMPTLAPLLNRCRGGHEQPVRNAIVQHFGLAIGDPLASLAWSTRIEEIEPLREVFLDGDVGSLSSSVLALRKKLRLEVAA